MSVNVVGGYPQYADTSINYIPQLFAPACLVKYYAKSCVVAIANTKYEGVIKNFGDKVTIRTRPDIQVSPYSKGMKLLRQVASSAPVVLAIDQAQYYDFVIDDVDSKQSDIVLSSEFSDDAAEQMRIALDVNVLGTVYAQVDAANQGANAGAISGAGGSGGYNLGTVGAPLAVVKQNVMEVITIITLVQNEYNVPEADRSGVIPAWFRYLLMNSDLKNASLMGEDPSIIRNGRIGEIDGQKLYMSNLLSVVTDTTGYKCTHSFWAQRDALTYAAQLLKNENFRCPDTFGWEYRGLWVYGFKVVKPQGACHLYCYKG